MARANSNSIPEARERREQYYDLRDQGVGILDAFDACGGGDRDGARRYERWYQAERVRGETVVPAKPAEVPDAIG